MRLPTWRGRRAARAVVALAILILILILILISGCGPSTVTPLASAAATASATSRATPNAPSLGQNLGTVRLGMTGQEVLADRGEPQQRTVTHGLGSPQWEYADGLVVYLRFPTSAQDPDRVWRLAARAPFSGSTGEGFRLGDSSAIFRTQYAAFTIGAPDQTQFQVNDGRGTILSVIFDGDRSSVILLQKG